MAKDSKDGVREVDDSGVLPVVEVAVPEHPSDDFHKRQAKALENYRVTGVVGEYIDQGRDQEPDIAPEFGVAPHPELANPAPPPREGRAGIGNPASGPVVDSFEDKRKASEDEEKRVKAVAKDSSGKDNTLSEADALNRHITPDESPKARDTATKG